MNTGYLDQEVAYLLGLLVARGELHETGIVIHFPKGALIAEGETTKFDINKEIQLGIDRTRERLAELLGADLKRVDAGDSWDLIASTTRKTMSWRNIGRLLEGKTDFSTFEVPSILLEKDTPPMLKFEFIRGFADVAGNVRPANLDYAGRHRIRLDIMNRPTNWKLPVHLCLLLQDHLSVPVPVITWGHPNLGREWREHQLNVYAEDFVSIGFSFDFKNQALTELAKSNQNRFNSKVKGCPGARSLRAKKPRNPEEKNRERLDSKLLNKHFNAYWQICRALGCPRRPAPKEQMELIPEV